MIADTALDPDRAAALDRFLADVESLNASHIERRTIAELLKKALQEQHADRQWGKLYCAVRVLLMRTRVSPRCADAYHRLESFLAENADLDIARNIHTTIIGKPRS